MKELFLNLYDYVMLIISSSSFYGPLFACLLIVIESIIPVLPLCVFVTILFLAYGYLIGYFLSYILTSIGCFLAFYLCRTKLKNIFNKKIRKIKKFDSFMKSIDTMSIPKLVLVLSIPFTPAFLVNIAASLSDMKFKKFATCILIGKLFAVFFWGFIGTSLVESLKNPKILLLIALMLGVAYLISKIVSKKLKLD